MDGQGAAAASRVALLFQPLPSFMRSLARALSHITERVTHEDWEDLMGPLAASLPYVAAFKMLDSVAGPDRASWEANMSAEYNRPISMRRYSNTSAVMPLAAQYIVVAAVVGPGAAAGLTPGSDALDSPALAAAIEEALATRRGTWPYVSVGRHARARSV